MYTVKISFERYRSLPESYLDDGESDSEQEEDEEEEWTAAGVYVAVCT